MRDTFIIFVSIIAAMALGGYLFIYGTPPTSAPSVDSTHPASVDSESFTVITQGTDAGSLTRRTNYRITDDAQFTELWRMIYGTSGPAIPIIDFNRYEVIAVFNGSHSTGGYSVSVAEITDKDGVRTVRIRRESPGDSCVVTQGITSPFQIIRTEKTALPIARAEEEVTSICP